MKEDWLSDARKIPDEVMNCLRRIAVRAVEEKHYSPELITAIFGISRSCIYEWLRAYHAKGEDALDTRKAPGSPPVMTSEIDDGLKKTILHSTPEDHGYDTVLWTLEILVDVLKKRFDLWVSDSTVALHLHQMNLSCQKPCYQAQGQDPEKVAHFINNKFKLIQKVAQKIGADIAFEDEAGIGVMTRSGRTWGEVGSPPKVVVSDQRGGYNVLSIVTPKGELIYDVEEKPINGARYIQFLQKVLEGRTRPLMIIADNVSFHRSKEVRDFDRANRQKIRMFFLPTHSPELNPDEQVWNEVKHRQLGKQPIRSKLDLNRRIHSSLKFLQEQMAKVRSFFQLPDTQYAALQESIA
jgi:transposase